MENQPVYVTFEFRGNLDTEVKKMTLGIQGLRDESAKTYQRLLSDSNAAYQGLSENNRKLAVSIQEDINSLRQLVNIQNALEEKYTKAEVSVSSYIEAKTRLNVLEKDLREGLSRNIKTFNDQIAAEGKATDSVSQLTIKVQGLVETYLSLSKAERNGEQGQGLIGQIQSIRAEIDKANQALREQVKVDNTVADSIAGLNKQVRELIISYNNLSKTQREGAEGQAMLARIQDLDKEIEAAQSHLAQYGRTAGTGFNSLNMSVQQVARELPSLTMGINMFFLAISNNLPILADSIQRARKEYAAFKAEGKAATPVWKQMLSSIVSWQTALVVGITLLTVYGKDIFNWIQGLFGANQAQKRLNESMTEFNSILAREEQGLHTLFSALEKAKEGTEGRRKAINDINAAYGKYLPNLLSEKSTITELRTAYQLVNTALREHAALKAQSSAIDKVMDKSIKKQSEALTQMRHTTAEKLGTEKSGGIMDIVTDLTEDFRSAGMTWEKAWQGVSTKIMSEIGKTQLGDSFYEELEKYIRSVYDSQKQIKDIQDQFNPFFNKKKADSAVIQNKQYWMEIKSQAESVLNSIDNEQKSLLDAGKTKGIDPAIVQAYKEAKENIDKATNALKIYDSYQKKADEKAKNAHGTNRLNSIVDEQEAAKVKQEKDLQHRIEQAKIDSMSEGWQKTKAQLALNHKKELDELDRQQDEYLRKIIEYERKKFEADPKNKGEIFNASQVQLTEEELSAFEKLSNKLKEKQLKEDNEFTTNLKHNQEDITNHFTSELERRLTEIDRYYEDEIKKAEGYQQQIDELKSNWQKDRNVAVNESKLNDNSFNQEVAVDSTALKYSGTGMLEVAEREKTEILKKYAQDRIKILERIGDEQSKQEIKSLDQSIAGYNKILAKPKSIKQIFDEQAFKAIEKHFEKTSASAEESEEKTSKFFQAFSDAGQIATEAVGGLKSMFGGISDELDMALDAVGNIAQGFAEGGLIGGISAAAGQLMSVVGNLLTARKEVDESMIEGYKAYIDVMDQLIEKQKEAIQSLGGSELNATIKKTLANISKEIAASRKLLNETLNSGQGVFSHSEGYKVRKMLEGYRHELSGIGINLQQLGGRADLSILPVEKLVRLQEELPEVWARLPEKVREYLNQIIESKEKMKELNQELQDMLLGFSADDVTSAIVDSLTDPSIENAMDNLSGKMDNFISGIVKNIIVKMALTEPITKAVSELMKGIATYDTDGNITGFKNISEIGTGVFSTFKDSIMGIASGFGETWKGISDELGSVGIDLGGVLSGAEGNGADSIAQSILDGLEAGKSGIKDFSSDFEDMMKKAVLNSIKVKYLEEPLRQWYKQFTEASETGLTEDKIASLKEQYDEIVQNASERLDDMEKITGVHMGNSRNASEKGIAAMSQESADRLNGCFETLLIYADKTCSGVASINTVLVQGLGVLDEIAENTSYCKRLENIEKDMKGVNDGVKDLLIKGLILRNR